MAICAYVRVSTDKQTNENQRFEIENWAAKRGWTIEKWVADDGVSGTRDYKKRKLGTLMSELADGDTLIACEISRFGRDLMMVMEILRALMDKHVKVFTVKDNFTLSDEIQSKVIAFAFGLAAEIERKLIQQRTKAALDRLKAEGKVLGRPKGRKSRPELSPFYGREAEILEMLKSGTPKKNICEHIGVNRATLLRYLKDSGLTEFIGEGLKRADLSPELLQALADKGYSFSRAARTLSVCAGTIRNYAERYGIDFHPGHEGHMTFDSLYDELNARKDEILIRRAGGESLAGIRESLGVSRTMWSYWLKRAGLSEIQNIKDARERSLEIRTLHAQGLSTRQIAVALHIRHKLVKLIVDGKDSGNDRISLRDLTPAERALAEQNGVHGGMLCSRLKDGWTVKDAICTPPIPRRGRHR